MRRPVQEQQEEAPVVRARKKPAAAAPQRLQKVLAVSGLGSRRDMEELIASGRVTVNGEPAQLGQTVGADDVVRIDKRVVKLQTEPQMPRVLLYHKLEGEIVSQDDPEKRASVFEKLPHIRGAKWVSIGRLDINTCGLMIFTTSGELANHFMHPRYEVEREYAVRVMGELTDEQLEQMTEGVELDDGIASFDAIQDRGGEGSNHWYQVILREGRKREVRRLFEAQGLMVSRLMRVRFGPVTLPPRLKRGQLLTLQDKEVRALLEWAGLPVPRSSQQQRPMTAREKEQVGKPFTPRASRIAMAAAAQEPKERKVRKAGWAKAKPKASFNPATKQQRRSDRNRGRG
ncbi:23S rRNA pseudouridine2605 synthase [Novimethylophilus kurashikiensis]|uniref:Pseudouridine synthase n=1 Tax=Novimethylophilus kurashikiensis TaxID=1825523 RepID=A0A2R5FB31_9PROT|nr:23S rRNA pseudouridine2605 synthase [Novimethylophilus kurashikiensis]